MTNTGPVLLVEDEHIVLESTAALLRDAGMEVLVAAEGKEAIAQLEARPDVATVVTDIDLREAPDGLELASTVAERWPHMRLIIVSGTQRPPQGKYPTEAIFFTKPYAPGALVTMVTEGD